MTPDQEHFRPPAGRYLMAAPVRWVLVLDAGFVTAGSIIARADPLFIASSVGAWLVAAAAWLIPVSVITETHIRRAIPRRAYRLADVDGCTVGTGLRSGVIQLHMRDGATVGLPGVPRKAIADVRRLIAANNSQRAPPALPQLAASADALRFLPSLGDERRPVGGGDAACLPTLT